MKTARKQPMSGPLAPKRSRQDHRKMDQLIDELYGCLVEGDALSELEREHRDESLSDEHRRP